MERIIEHSGWDRQHVTIEHLESTVTGGQKRAITFSRPPGSTHNDVTATIEYVPDLMMSALTLTVTYVDVRSGDESSKVFGSSPFDQLGFLAALKQQLDERRYDAEGQARQRLRREIEDMTSALRTARRIEHLLTMHDLYSQLRALGEVGRLTLEPLDRGRYIVELISSRTNQVVRDYSYERIINTVRPPLEAVIAAGILFDGEKVTLDLYKNPGGMSRDEVMARLHELLDDR